MEASAAAIAKLPHCKDPSHLAVAVTPSQFTTLLTATFVPHLECKNTAYTGWGVVLSFKAASPLDGLHLLPEAVLFLPAQLRDHAAACTGGQTVSIFHTVLTILTHFATQLPRDALNTATEIETAAKQAPATA